MQAVALLLLLSVAQAHCAPESGHAAHYDGHGLEAHPDPGPIAPEGPGHDRHDCCGLLCHAPQATGREAAYDGIPAPFAYAATAPVRYLRFAVLRVEPLDLIPVGSRAPPFVA